MTDPTSPVDVVERACGAHLDAFVAQAEPRLKKMADQLYCELLDGVQCYLRENAHWNLSAELKRCWDTQLENERLRKEAEAAAALIRELEGREKALLEALKPFAEAMAWEETEGNFGASFMPDAPAQRFRDEVELRIVAWWGKDWELESADTFCTLGDLRRAAKLVAPASPTQEQDA